MAKRLDGAELSELILCGGRAHALAKFRGQSRRAQVTLASSCCIQPPGNSGWLPAPAFEPLVKVIAAVSDRAADLAVWRRIGAATDPGLSEPALAHPDIGGCVSAGQNDQRLWNRHVDLRSCSFTEISN